MVHADNPYLFEIERVLPRILAAADRDPLSPTLGLSDRLHWAWKLQDYANATPQCVVHGLARLIKAGQLPAHVGQASVIGRIDEMIAATQRISSRDGSLVEAFPNEKSFCVTALAAFDILATADLLEGVASREQLASWRRAAEPMVDFLCRNDETHGIISNHLATAVAALMRWRGAGGSVAHDRALELLNVIVSNQSSEGWYSEYGGADPGYQSLAVFYLADVHLRQPGLGLHDSLDRALGFLTWFAHPDGSFGGVYGARNTRFLVPGGLEALAADFPAAAALANFARRSIAEQRVVTLGALDDPNLAPHFNAYAWASEVFQKCDRHNAPALPFEAAEPRRHYFQSAGLIVDAGRHHYTVVSLNKGGVVAHFDSTRGIGVVDPGVAAEDSRGTIYTTQTHSSGNRVIMKPDGTIVVEAPFARAVHERPTPAKFLVLRFLCLTLFWSRPLGEWFKRMLVRRLVASNRPAGVTNCRTITLGPDLSIKDEQHPADRLTRLSSVRPFTAIHMASSGYWQRQDDAS